MVDEGEYENEDYYAEIEEEDFSTSDYMSQQRIDGKDVN